MLSRGRWHAGASPVFKTGGRRFAPPVGSIPALLRSARLRSVASAPSSSVDAAWERPLTAA